MKDTIYDLKPGVMHINGIDSEVLFELIPYEPIAISETKSDFSFDELDDVRI